MIQQVLFALPAVAEFRGAKRPKALKLVPVSDHFVCLRDSGPLRVLATSNNAKWFKRTSFECVTCGRQYLLTEELSRMVVSQEERLERSDEHGVPRCSSF